MSGEQPTGEQAATLQGILEDYGVVRWQMEAGAVVALDCEGDEWRIAADGEPTCVGGTVVASGAEPEEEDS